MAENNDLAKIVLENTGKVMMEKDPVFKVLCDGETGLAASVLQSMAGILEDKEWKFKILSGPFIGYGYDFTKKDKKNGRLAKDSYESALKATREMAEKMPSHFEHPVENGVVNERFGWYVTRLPG